VQESRLSKKLVKLSVISVSMYNHFCWLAVFFRQANFTEAAWKLPGTDILAFESPNAISLL